MDVTRNTVVITEEDYRMLKPFTDRMPDKAQEMSLAYEIGRAVIVKKEAFPSHAIRLNSKVSVLDLETNKKMQFRIVMPENADMRQSKISVLTPMGTALLGFRKGEEIKWKVPAGMKSFRILEVDNS
ncbi:MAG TPA: GreA/GreB family elongation factor [Flavipsychrobacter sp.]|jgi:regulator of nucleoside diphosphate kinase|nr:GreA/GreB family elongation factor [Flavipsychrobacter sp.]